MKLFYLLVLSVLQIQGIPVVPSGAEAQELAVFVRGGLHTNHYWACDHTALVEVSEGKEKETDVQVNPTGVTPEMAIFRFVRNFHPTIFNPQNLQWAHLPLFVLLGNFRL